MIYKFLRSGKENAFLLEYLKAPLGFSGIRYSIGQNAMRQVAADAGAVIRVGKSYLINFSKVDAYMDSLSE